MRNCFSSPKLKKSDFSTCECECNCHNSKELELNPQDFVNTHKTKSVKSYLSQSQIITVPKEISQPNLNKGLCTCKEICNCPCHGVTCLCCPCVSDKSDINDYYKNLYYQVKSELEIEKKRNDRIKYNKKLNENNIEKMKKEKEMLVLEINSLKNKVNELMNKLRKETKRNSFNIETKNEYEKTIEKMNTQIHFLNEKNGLLTKDNSDLKLKIKKRNFTELNNKDKIIEELKNKINEMELELNNNSQYIVRLKNENEELNKELEEVTEKFNIENGNLNTQNLKLTQNININCSEINRLKEEIAKLKKEKSFVEESLFNLKNGNENKNNEITQLKYLLKQKEEEIEEMGLEFEKIKNEFNTLNLNYIEVNQQIDYFKDIEKKYNELIPKFNLLKKNNEENIRTIQQNEKNINILNNKLYKKEIECNNLIKENELLKQDLIKLEHIENKYNELNNLDFV